MHSRTGVLRFMFCQTMTSTCVITLGVNSKSPPGHPDATFQDYSRGIARVRDGLGKVGYTGPFLAWDQRYPEGSPTSEEAFCAFKPFCFAEAQVQGYQLVLWLDAGIRIRHPLDPLFESIRRRGYLFFPEEHSVGEFCKDQALGPLGITREESFAIPCCRSTVIGLDFASPRAVEFLRQWKERATDGISFPGPKWSGVHGWPRTASQDPRVKGHRHDQTVASVIAHQLGMKEWESWELFYRCLETDPGFVRRYHGEPRHRKIVDAVRSGGRLARRLLNLEKARR
jgi:hypothetical protein